MHIERNRGFLMELDNAWSWTDGDAREVSPIVEEVRRKAAGRLIQTGLQGVVETIIGT